MYFPLHLHSHYSLLDGLSKPDQIAARVTEIGSAGCALTDHGSVSGAVDFLVAMKKAKKKAILGNEFYLCGMDATRKEADNRSLSHLCVLARNLEGWKGLLQATSAANQPDHFYYRPRLDLARLARFSRGHFLTFSGHMGSDLANCLFEDPKSAYRARNTTEARMMLAGDWRDRAVNLAGRYQELFGKENFRLETQRIDQMNLPSAGVVADCMDEVSKLTGIKRVATADSHYCNREDAEDQRILLCAAFETTLKEVQARLAAQEDVGLGAFFQSSRYHIPSPQEMGALHSPEELAESILLAEMCEAYDITGRPMLPVFPCPAGMTPDTYLMALCDQGWDQRILSKPNAAVYRERLQHELSVLLPAGLASYFLIVQDYCNWARAQGWMVGKGRGSGAGCLVSYLLGITDVDPLEYGLLFERFYNAGRNTADRVSLPDIDCDFPISKREQVKEYMRKRYGEDRVCDMATFARMQGRGALKDVLRAHSVCSYEEMNRITDPIPDEAAIADQLQEMREETGEASIIRWALENEAEALKEWCYLDKEGNLQGPLAPRFAQAIRLEGTKRSQGKHAAGVVISSQPLSELCPMVYDKSTKRQYAGLEMTALEKMGLVKFDILGVAVLDKLMGAIDVIRNGRLT